MGIPLENNRMARAHQPLLHVGPIHVQLGHAAAIAVGCDPLDGNAAIRHEDGAGDPVLLWLRAAWPLLRSVLVCRCTQPDPFSRAGSTGVAVVAGRDHNGGEPAKQHQRHCLRFCLRGQCVDLFTRKRPRIRRCQGR